MPEIKPTKSQRQRQNLRLFQLIHVYTSMIALAVVLFFGITGVTLNHPAWTLGDDVNKSTTSGVVPFDVAGTSGSVDFLALSEFARNELGASGTVDGYDSTETSATIAYKKAGYSALLTANLEDNSFEWTAEQFGWVAVFNDLHKGRHTGGLWRVVIDVSAIFLVVISLSGLVMQFYLRRRKKSAIVTSVVGLFIVAILIVITQS